jgi:Family of unknown function (DUF5989)
VQFVQSLYQRAAIARELTQFFSANKWWWLTPLIVMLLLFGVVIVLAESSAIAPFIYTLF